MHRAVPYALAALAVAVFAILAITISPVDTTHLLSGLTSAFTSAAVLPREFCRRTLMSIHFDHSFMAHGRVLVVEQLHAIYHAAEMVLVPYIGVCHRVVTNAIKQFHILTSAEEHVLPRVSYDSITYYPQYGSHAWDVPPTRPAPDFIPNNSILFFLMATNFCTALFCLFISSAIWAPLRFVWRSIKSRAHPAAKPQVTWETVIEELGHAAGKLAAGVITMLLLCAAGVLFCLTNAAVWVINLNIGFELARLEVPPPQVIYRTLEDSRVPKLQEQNRSLHDQLEGQKELLKYTRTIYDADTKQLDGDIENLENDKKDRDVVIQTQQRMLASIGMTRPLYDQYQEQKKRADDNQKEKDLIIEKKKQSDEWYAKQLGDQFENRRKVKRDLRAEKEEHAELRKLLVYYQDRANNREEVSKLQINSYRKRIQDLEKSMASKEETLEALRKERDQLIASQKENTDLLKAQLEERDELINGQKKAIQNLEARMKEQEERHASQKSESASAKRNCDREMKKRTKACELSSGARKAAEEQLKAEREARKTANQELEAERKARKAVEEELEAEKQARKAAEEKSKELQHDLEQEETQHGVTSRKRTAERMARTAAEAEVASLKAQLATVPPSHDKGTQTSSPPPSPRKTPPVSPIEVLPGSPGEIPPAPFPPSPSKVPPPAPVDRKTGFPPLPPSPPPPRPARLPPPEQRAKLPLKSRNRMLKSTGESGAKKEGPMPAPKAGNGAAVPDMSKFNFSFSNIEDIFGGGPSPKPEVLPTGLSLPEPAPAEGSPAKPASPSGEQPDPPGPPSA